MRSRKGTKRWAGDCAVEIVELRVVEYVVCVSSKRECGMLPKRNIAHETDVPDILARTVESRAWCIA